MNRRRTLAVLALLGVLDSVYLLLHKLGTIGTLACTVQGACDTVNTSEYSVFLGVPVAAYGVLGYLGLLGIALAGLQPRWQEDARPDRVIALLAGPGAVFSIYLTYLSVFRIGTVCPWCLVSLGLILGIFVLAVWGVLGNATAVTAERRPGQMKTG